MGGEKSLHSGDKSEVVSTPQAPYTTGSPTPMHPWHLQQVSWKECATAVQDPLELPKKLAHSLPTLSSQQSQSTLPEALSALGIVLRALQTSHKHSSTELHPELFMR